MRISQADYDALVKQGCLPALPKKPSKLPMKRHDLADSFMELWKRLGPPIEPVREYRFHETRKWRFDVAFLAQRVAIELEGGVWTRGRHTRGSGFKGDIEKYNAAIFRGWRILRFTTNDLDLSPIQTIEKVVELLTTKGSCDKIREAEEGIPGFTQHQRIPCYQEKTYQSDADAPGKIKLWGDSPP